MLLVPLPYCRRLSCGKRHHITMSDPVPNALRRCCGYHVNQGVMQTARPPSLNRRETVFSVVGSSSRRVSREDLEEEDTDLKHFTPEQLKQRRERRREAAIQRILMDTQIKTRDIWSYSTVLFFCEFCLQQLC